MPLHSTMFLLIREALDREVSFVNFTFHNVSINTDTVAPKSRVVLSFTFHNVSINTNIVNTILKRYITLHSTMFLLIQVDTANDSRNPGIFTFHNVSINTRRLFIPTIQI